MRFSILLLAGALALASSEENATSTASPAPPTTTASTTTQSTAAPTPEPTTSTTTKAPSSTTTEAPSSTTTEAPSSTTPKPTPKLELEKYNLTSSDGKVCLLLWTKMTILQNGKKLDDVADANINHEQSSCAPELIRLWVEWSDNRFQMEIQNDNKTFFISSLNVTVNKTTAGQQNLSQFQTVNGSYYQCHEVSVVDLKENNVTVAFSDMKFQAFGTGSKEEFTGSAVPCSSDKHNDVIIIAVGCAMAILVVIILVAYLIARRRNRQRGYQSV